LATQRNLTIAGQSRLGGAVELHGAVAGEPDDAERQMVELEQAGTFGALGEIGRVEINGGVRHGLFLASLACHRRTTPVPGIRQA
jgi:hypothetical protein